MSELIKTNMVTEAIFILGGGFIGLLLVIVNIVANRNVIEPGNPLCDEDPVIRIVFSFLLVFFAPIGGAELGALLVVILKNFGVLS